MGPQVGRETPLTNVGWVAGCCVAAVSTPETPRLWDSRYRQVVWQAIRIFVGACECRIAPTASAAGSNARGGSTGRVMSDSGQQQIYFEEYAQHATRWNSILCTPHGSRWRAPHPVMFVLPHRIDDNDEGPGPAPDGSEVEVLATIGGAFSTDGACELPVHTLTAEDVAKHKAATTAVPDVSESDAAEAAEVAKANPTAAAEALRLAGNECFGAKRFAEAIEHYTEALTLDEDNGLIHGNRSAALLQLGKPREALADAKRMALLLPENPKAHFRLGAALSACDQPADACRAYAEAMRLDAANEAVAEALKKELGRPALKKGKQHTGLVQQMQKALAERNRPAGATGDIPRVPWVLSAASRGANKPPKRGGAVLCAAAGRIWLIGGADRMGTVHGDVWEYADGSWQSHGDLGDATAFVPRCGHAAATVGEDLIVVYGGQEPCNQTLLGDLACLRVPVEGAVGGVKPQWQTQMVSKVAGVSPEARNGHSLSFDPKGVGAKGGEGAGDGDGGGCLILFGGANDEAHVADVHRLILPDSKGLDGAVWDAPKVTGIRPAAREMHIAALLPTRRVLVIHGGRSSDNVLGDVCVLNVDNWIWAAPVDSACQRVGHACTLVASGKNGESDGRLLVFGGFSGSTFCNDTWEVSAGAAEPSERLPAQDAPTRRFAHAMTALGQKIFVFGGSGGNDDYDDLYEASVAKTLDARAPSL